MCEIPTEVFIDLIESVRKQSNLKKRLKNAQIWTEIQWRQPKSWRNVAEFLPLEWWKICKTLWAWEWLHKKYLLRFYLKKSASTQPRTIPPRFVNASNDWCVSLITINLYFEPRIPSVFILRLMTSAPSVSWTAMPCLSGSEKSFCPWRCPQASTCASSSHEIWWAVAQARFSCSFSDAWLLSQSFPKKLEWHKKRKKALTSKGMNCSVFSKILHLSEKARVKTLFTHTLRLRSVIQEKMTAIILAGSTHLGGMWGGGA